MGERVGLGIGVVRVVVGGRKKARPSKEGRANDRSVSISSSGYTFVPAPSVSRWESGRMHMQQGQQNVRWRMDGELDRDWRAGAADQGWPQRIAPYRRWPGLSTGRWGVFFLAQPVALVRADRTPTGLARLREEHRQIEFEQAIREKPPCESPSPTARRQRRECGTERSGTLRGAWRRWPRRRPRTRACTLIPRARSPAA